MEPPDRFDRSATEHSFDSPALSKLAQAGRSSTVATPFGIASAKDSKRSHLSLHHHHHRHHHSRRDKHAAIEKNIKSAVLPSTRLPFGDFVKPGKEGGGGRLTPLSTGTSASVAAGNTARGMNGSLKSVSEEYDTGLMRVSSRLVRPADVAKERARQKQRNEQLRTALRALSEQSMATTRRLDDTYYSILEKLSGLHSTIDGLQELSTLMKQLGAEFAADADDVVDEVNNSLDSIGDFDAQARQLEDFEARIMAGKKRAGKLNERLDNARKRVDEREKLEEDWRLRVSRRLRILWGILGALVGLFVIAYIIHSVRNQPQQVTGPRSSGLKSSHSIDFERITVPPPVREILESVHSSSSSTSYPPAFTSKGSTKDDRRLRVFDEL